MFLIYPPGKGVEKDYPRRLSPRAFGDVTAFHDERIALSLEVGMARYQGSHRECITFTAATEHEFFITSPSPTYYYPSWPFWTYFRTRY